MKKILLRVFIPILAIILIIGYFGFIPGISNLFGSNRPKDLGIKYDSNDLESAKKKTNIKFIELNKNLQPIDSIKFSGQTSVKTQLSSQELTALARELKWNYLPLRNITIKIDKDGYMETSSNLYGNKVMEALRAYNITPLTSQLPWSLFEIVYGAEGNEKVQQFYSTIDKISKFLKSNPSFYTKGKAKIINNKITEFKIEAVYLGKLNITGMVNNFNESIKSFIEDIITNTPGLYVKSLSFQDMKLNFDGTLPERILFSP